jgi:hypothetical protein
MEKEEREFILQHLPPTGLGEYPWKETGHVLHTSCLKVNI